MQLLEKVRETEFLGREFLVWLWFKAETGEGLFDLEEAGKVELWFDGKMTLQSENDHGVETITCTGENPYLMKEARFALSENKEIVQASIKMIIGENQYSFILDPTWMNFKSFKSPKVIQEKEDPDGTFYEKIFLLEEAVSAIDIIFSSFIKVRISPEWEADVRPALGKWIMEGQGKIG